MPSTAPVSHISETAQWVAVYRAMESERPDPLFSDPFARRLAGARGQEIVDRMPRGRQLAWSMIVRTVLIDEIIRRAVGRDGVDTVLNLAAGLDTRPYRLGLPDTVRWIEADLPDLLHYKEEQLAGERPSCTLESAKLDLTDVDRRMALFRRVNEAATRTLVVAEGLLIYLERDQVAQLARDLRSQGTFRWWLIDLALPRLLKMMERTWGKRLRAGGSPMIFAPPEGTGFFEPHGWREAEFRSIWMESMRLNRTMRLARFWDWVSRFLPEKKREELRRTTGVVLLERTDRE